MSPLFSSARNTPHIKGKTMTIFFKTIQILHKLKGSLYINLKSWLVLLLFSIPAWADTYYVANTGSNSNIGSINSPWLTIQFGVDLLNPGDILLVKNGDYDGFIVSHSGTSSAPITIQANGEAVNITTDTNRGDDPDERITINNSSYIIIEGFNIPGDQTRGNGFGAHGATPSNPMHGLIIRNNSIFNTGSSSSPGNTCLYVSNADGTLLEQNTLHNCAEHGIYIANAGAKNTIVRDNKIYNNGVEGIHNNGDRFSGGDGLLTGLIITNNEIHDNGQTAISMDGVQDSMISNNLIYKNGRHGIGGYAIDGAGGPKNITIVNNTFNGNSGYAVRFSEDEGNHIIFNNILLSDGGSIRSDSVTAASSYISNHNITTNKFSTNSGDTTITLQQWNELKQQDENSIIDTANNLFMNNNINDYSLSTNSTAINSGTNAANSINAPENDYDDTVRPQGIYYDIGAYELAVPPAPTGISVKEVTP